MTASQTARTAPNTALAVSAGVRRLCRPVHAVTLPGDLSEYLMQARRVDAATFAGVQSAVPLRGAVFFVLKTLQRRRAAVC
ncbi:hypothetical protein [Crenobacter cavernae]|uniref:Uncharacterized protein n=1 Tax=Crenobacter cavernae TaxID=2290923 RepID=A0A345Y5N1_9NEIS|nr:hypothetical protein [Crenobacter cavernae]AXK39233.1 hypothetical protein DWG20_07205 [Crenobacter cavernae]